MAACADIVRRGEWLDPVPRSLAIAVFVAIAALIFGLVARFGDLPRLLGAVAPRDR